MYLLPGLLILGCFVLADLFDFFEDDIDKDEILSDEEKKE